MCSILHVHAGPDYDTSLSTCIYVSYMPIRSVLTPGLQQAEKRNSPDDLRHIPHLSILKWGNPPILSVIGGNEFEGSLGMILLQRRVSPSLLVLWLRIFPRAFTQNGIAHNGRLVPWGKAGQMLPAFSGSYINAPFRHGTLLKHACIP